jgi:hypothetical protein
MPPLHWARSVLKTTIATKQLAKRLRKLERKTTRELLCSVYSNYNATDGIASQLIAAATIKRIPNVAQGDNVLDRDGNQIVAHKLDYRAILQNTDVNSQAVRLIMFYWNSDTAPTVTDIVLTPAAGAGVPNTPMQNINEVSVANQHLKIFHDKVYFVTANAAGTGASVRSIRIRRKLGRTVYYNDTAAANMTRGYYYLLYSTDVDLQVQDGINFYFYEK